MIQIERRERSLCGEEWEQVGLWLCPSKGWGHTAQKLVSETWFKSLWMVLKLVKISRSQRTFIGNCQAWHGCSENPLKLYLTTSCIKEEEMMTTIIKMIMSVMTIMKVTHLHHHHQHYCHHWLLNDIPDEDTRWKDTNIGCMSIVGLASPKQKWVLTVLGTRLDLLSGEPWNQEEDGRNWAGDDTFEKISLTALCQIAWSQGRDWEPRDQLRE